MDVNQTRFHLLMGQNDWTGDAAGDASVQPGSPVQWNPSDAAITLNPRLFIFPPPASKKELDGSERRGAGQDRYGNWYWIGDDPTELRFLGLETNQSEHFWSGADDSSCCTKQPGALGAFLPAVPPAVRQLTLSGLAVTCEHYLLVGLVDPKGILAFDLYAGGTPLELHWPKDVAFTPYDLAPTPDGGAWILDRANKSYWMVDRTLRVGNLNDARASVATKTATFAPVSGAAFPAGAASNPVPISAEFAVALKSASDPVAIEGLPDGSVLILDNPTGAAYSVVSCYRGSQLVGASVALATVLQPYTSSDATAVSLNYGVRAQDFAFVPAPNQGARGVTGKLYLASVDGEQTFLFDLAVDDSSLSLTLVPQYFPMWFFGGKALIGANGSVFYDSQGKWIQLVPQPRPRYEISATFQLPPQGVVSSNAAGIPAFDGKRPACIWHRLLLDASIPSGASVAIESRAADSPSLLADVPWQSEPRLYMRDDGPEIPFYRAPLRGPATHTGTWELLFQNAVGRYLQLRMTLSGPGSLTPRLQSMRIYYPRFSYLTKYLPAAYQDDPVSSSFLDRYLANVEGFFTVIEGKIVHTPALFDVRTVPPEDMDWLALWMGVSLDMSWDERKRRLFLAHLPQIFRERGTKAGLERAIRLTLEPCPDDSLFDSSSCSGACCGGQICRQSLFSIRIVERFLTRQAPGVVFSNTSATQTPQTATSTAWIPAYGAQTLHTDFRNFLKDAYQTVGALNSSWGTSFTDFSDTNILFPPLAPTNKAEKQDWLTFVTGKLIFTYAAPTPADLPLFLDFLQAQYPSISKLNSAYQLSGSDLVPSFDAIQFPTVMPSGGQALMDWIEFVAEVLPTQRNAHRFTVLVPIQLSDDQATQSLKIQIAQRIATIEKPAHTQFDVKPYWALFRAGDARLGQDTLLGLGSRFAALVLSRDALAAGYLAYEAPWDVRTRATVAGRSTGTMRCASATHRRCA